MSFYLLVPMEGGGRERAAQLAKVVGARRLSSSRAAEVVSTMVAQSGGPQFSSGQSLGLWTLLEVPDADPARLSEISRFVSERLEKDGVALVDLDERLFSVSELQEAAAGLGLGIELVAVVKAHGSPPPPLAPEYQVLLDAITSLGGRSVASGEIARHLGELPAKVRRRLRLLVEWGRIVRNGRQGGARYSLAGEGTEIRRAKPCQP